VNKETTMNRTLKIALGAGLALILGLVGATAIAARSGHLGFHHGHEFMRKRVSAFIDDALDAAKATTAQRTAIHEARDQAFAALQDAHKGMKPSFEEALALFEADKLDAARVDALRARHQAVQEKTGDAIVRALTTAHDVLDAKQRLAVAEYVREHRPGRHGGEIRGEFMKRMASSKIDDALDAVDATAAQRTIVEAARDHVFAAFEEAHVADPGQHMEKAIALFAEERLEPSQVAAVRAEHLAQARKIGDAVVQAIYDVHDALTPAQRRTLTGHIREQHARFAEHEAR
jgi:hypothetical protein